MMKIMKLKALNKQINTTIENNSKIITGSEEKNTRLRSRNIELLNKYHENQEFSFQVKDEILKTSGMRCEKA